MQLQRMFLDIETSPCIGYFWKPGYKVRLDYANIVVEPRIICACWKWEGARKTYSVDWGKRQDDKRICKEIVVEMDKADEIVAHYGEGFDIPWIRGRCLYHEVQCQDRYKVVDTLRMAGKRKFRFNSRSLDYIGQYLGVGKKIKTDYGLWKDVVEKKEGALAKMIRYCKNDVVLLEGVYHKLAQYSPPSTHVGVLEYGDKWQCGHCASTDVRMSKRGVTAMGTPRFQMRCKACNRYYSICSKAYDGWLEWKVLDAAEKRK